jgi:hypothetical protein
MDEYKQAANFLWQDLYVLSFPERYTTLRLEVMERRIFIYRIMTRLFFYLFWVILALDLTGFVMLIV